MYCNFYFDEVNAFTLPNTILDDTFLKCRNTCNRCAYNCNTCINDLNRDSETTKHELHLVCLSCKLKCHKGHSLVERRVTNITKYMCTKC